MLFPHFVSEIRYLHCSPSYDNSLQTQYGDEFPLDVFPLHNVRREAFLRRGCDLGLVVHRAGVSRTQTLAEVAHIFADIWRTSCGVVFQEPELVGGPVLRALVVMKKGAINPQTGLAALCPRTIESRDLVGDLADGKTTYGRSGGLVRLTSYDTMGQEAYLLRLSRCHPSTIF